MPQDGGPPSGKGSTGGENMSVFPEQAFKLYIMVVPKDQEV